MAVRSYARNSVGVAPRQLTPYRAGPGRQHLPPRPGRPGGRDCEMHCRACSAVFDRSGPPPYHTICPYCVSRGDIVTLTRTPAAGA